MNPNLMSKGLSTDEDIDSREQNLESRTTHPSRRYTYGGS